MINKITIHWFRRDLRLEDNTALNAALNSKYPVLPLFIFDTNIIEELPKNDARVSFIYKQLKQIDTGLFKRFESGIIIKKGEPVEIWKELVAEYDIAEVHYNRDYEPYAIKRDNGIINLLIDNGIEVTSHQDHVVFEYDKILKKDASPYTIYTPYKNQWLKHYEKVLLLPNKGILNNFLEYRSAFPSINSLGFNLSTIEVPDWKSFNIDDYATKRDFPYMEGTTHLSPHLRFGTISIREILKLLDDSHHVFLSELIWREFFIQILVNFPDVANNNFKRKYNAVQWRNDEGEFQRWCEGTTGYPMVDAGMRQLNETGYMHNRVRMICASFLCKHLLIDWQWGEAYFAQKLLDYELSSNNGNWQWAAGTGCDAAPYFRVFNPAEQQRKFDPHFIYIRKWVKEFDQASYPSPIVEHKTARERAIVAYRSALNGKKAI